ncbi:hypothetical protein OE855_002594 [Salmonella enterica subsp. enterica serovar Schwarzengrund]|nr:hypothetical protein [Salmonella enterica subsp. enterica serovar Schwarzengrund]
MNHVNAIRCNDEYQCSHCGKSWDIHEEAPDCKMTLVDLQKFKTVDYFGLSLTFPKYFKYITTDIDGKIRVYTNEPELKQNYWFCRELATLVATVNLHGLNWRETLRKC